MSESTDFADVLKRYVTRSAYTGGQLARLTGIPKPTILSWLDGRVKRPRSYSDLVKLSEAMHFTPAETVELLQAAGFAEVAARMEESLEEEAEDGSTAAPFQTIPALPYFVGRQQLIQEIEEFLISHDQARFCCLQGMAGAGKSALAAQVAYRLRACFADGVLWANVGRADPMTVLATFAHAYGVDVDAYSDLESRSQMVRQILADKQALIVLDDVRQGEGIQSLLPPSTGACAVIVTTRRHDLFVTAGMHRIEVGAFEDGQQVSLQLFNQFLENDTIALNRETLLQIADLLGHLPLAVAIVASRLAYEPGWLPADFLARLQHTHGWLAELAYDDRSVRVSFKTSYDLLSPHLQQFFTQLGLFDGRDFTPEAVAYVTEMSSQQAEDYLRRLYVLSLCQLARPGFSRLRYTLHPLLSQYAVETAVDPEYPRAAYQRLIDYYIDYVERYRANVQMLAVEAKNILAALKLAQRYHFDESFHRGVAAFQPFLQEVGMQRWIISLLRRK